jgi:hypothetical protein
MPLGDVLRRALDRDERLDGFDFGKHIEAQLKRCPRGRRPEWRMPGVVLRKAFYAACLRVPAKMSSSRRWFG